MSWVVIVFAIVLPSIVGFVIIVLIIYCCCCKKKKNETTPEGEEDEHDHKNTDKGENDRDKTIDREASHNTKPKGGKDNGPGHADKHRNRSHRKVANSEEDDEHYYKKEGGERENHMTTSPSPVPTRGNGKKSKRDMRDQESDNDYYNNKN